MTRNVTSSKRTAAKYEELFPYRRPRRRIQKYFVGQKRPIPAHFVVAFHRRALFRRPFRSPCTRASYRLLNKMRHRSTPREKKVSRAGVNRGIDDYHGIQKHRRERRVGLDESSRRCAAGLFSFLPPQSVSSRTSTISVLVSKT